MPFAAAPAPIVHTGNGSSDTKAISFVYYAKSHVRVRQRTAADTALTTLTEGVDYSLTAAGDENGGTLTFTTAPATGYKTYIDLDIPNDQNTRYRDGDARLAATQNQELDKIVQRLAFIEEQLARAFKLPIADTGSDMEGVQEKATLLGKVAVFDATSGKLTGVDAEDALNGASALTTRGDMLYRNATVPARLAVGANNSFLVSDGTDPVWESASDARTSLGNAIKALGGLTPAANKIGYFDGSDTAALADFLAAATSWTPVLTFATPGDLSVAYTHQVGRYVRIGPLIVAEFGIQTSTFTHTTASGSLQITGLPTAHLSATGLLLIGALNWGGITKANYTHINLLLNGATATLNLYACGSGQSPAVIGTGDCPTGGSMNLRGVAVYLVA